MAEKRRVEVLAPAGSYESMEAAFAAGADAVYIGGSRFGARAYADNPDREMLCRAIDYAHLHGGRLYMTVNTLFKEQEIKELPEYLLPYYRQGLDAVIVQDLGAMALIREVFPDLSVHASTQMTITGVYGARMLKELGASRVVTARELSLEEIRQIHQQVDVEIESFIHGALCYCYSGQCLMSSLIGGRSGNRGRCAQPCRLPYEVWQKEEQEKEWYKRQNEGQGKGQNEEQSKRQNKEQGKRPSKEQDRHQNKEQAQKQRQEGRKKLNKTQDAFVLSMKDLCTLDLLPDILEAGVYSLKIEGRMKSPRYTAGVTSIYRKYVDLFQSYGREGYWVDPKDKQMLLDLFDRGGFTEGYYTQHNGKSMLALKEKPAFREVSQQLLEDIDRKWIKKKLQEPISGEVELTPGKAAKFILCRESDAERENRAEKENQIEKENKAEGEKQTKEVQALVYGQEVQIAQKQPMTKETISKQFNKTGNTPFYFTDLTITLNGDVFLPLQALNELRRRGLEELENQVLSAYFRQTDTVHHRLNLQEAKGRWNVQESGQMSEIQELGNTERIKEQKKSQIKEENKENRESQSPYFVVSIEETDQLSPVLARKEIQEIYLDADGFPAEVWEKTVAACHQKGKKCLLLMPEIFRREAAEYFAQKEKQLETAGFDGFVVHNLEEAEWLKEQTNKPINNRTNSQTNKPQKFLPSFLVFDASLYTWNHRAVQAMQEAGAARITVPSELNSRELRERGLQGQEILIYGRLPMMVSAQCIQKTVQGCSKKRGKLWLKDRAGKEMLVKNRCRFCYNTIYNGSPLSFLGQERLVEDLQPGVLRLHFTDETSNEMEKLLTAFIDCFYYRREAVFPFGAFTRGHFKRGVE